MDAQPALINTSLQRGDIKPRAIWNRFNGFAQKKQTVETVLAILKRSFTGLKPGANENCSWLPYTSKPDVDQQLHPQESCFTFS